LLDCPERPFGKWFKKNFPQIDPIYGFSQFGIFAVAREHIIQHSIEYYQSLISYLDHHHNPEAGHFFEVSWGAIFYPYPDAILVSCRPGYFCWDTDLCVNEPRAGGARAEPVSEALEQDSSESKELVSESSSSASRGVLYLLISIFLF
jgi:hypothetical protein